MPRFVLLVALCCLVLVSVAGGAAASSPPLPCPSCTPAPAPDPTPGPSTPAPSPPDEGTPAATPGTPGGGNSDGGDGSLPDITIDIDPASFATGAFVGIAEAVAAGVETFLGGLTAAIFGVPVVGDIDDVSSWTVVDGPFWPVVWTVYLIMTSLALLVLGGGIMHALSNYAGRALTQRLWTIGISFGMIALGWWVTQFSLHLGNALALAFAPDPSAIFATPGNAGKFGLTLVVGGVLLLVNAGAVVAAVVVILAEKAVLLICVALWPIFWAFRPLGGYADTVAGLGLGTFFGVLGAKVLQAVVAFMVWNIDWTGVHAVEAIGALLGTVIGTGITFVGIPLIVGRNFIPEAMTMFGRPAVDVADDFSESARGRAREQARAATNGYSNSARGTPDTTTRTDTPRNATPRRTPSLRNSEAPQPAHDRRSRQTPTPSVSVAADDPYLDSRSERAAERQRRERTRRTE